MNDALIKFKTRQKESWSLFTPLELMTTIPAAYLVNFAKIKSGQSVLDVGCGTGVVAVTAARLGAKTAAIDLCPQLLKQAVINANIAEVNIDLQEGDVEELPYPNHSFDVVLSQFGHMFAPRPQVAITEMLRVLKPGGIIAFSTWPPQFYVGRLFDLVYKFKPLPDFVSPPSKWGNPDFVREQLGSAVSDLAFDDAIMRYPALSVDHYRRSVEATVGPVLKLVQESQDDPTTIQQFRDELKSLANLYFKDNYVHQTYLLSRARKI